MSKYTQEEYRIILKEQKTKHGMYGTRFYRIYRHMFDRCNRPKHHAFHRYGGRGIKLLWVSFEDFYRDMYESYKKHVEEFGERNTSIDRIDNENSYCKENCKWSTPKEQCNNRKNIRKRVKFLCGFCGKENERVPSWIKGKRTFCDRICVANFLKGKPFNQIS